MNGKVVKWCNGKMEEWCNVICSERHSGEARNHQGPPLNPLKGTYRAY